MEKIEVEQGFLASLIELAQKPFLNSKKEEKEKEEDVKVDDDDEMEYEGKKYSKKELVNCYTEKKNSEAEEEAKKGKGQEEKEEEKKNSVDADVEDEKAPSNDDMQFFNSMQELMATASQDPNDKIQVYSQKSGLELGSKIFG